MANFQVEPTGMENRTVSKKIEYMTFQSRVDINQSSIFLLFLIFCLTIV